MRTVLFVVLVVIVVTASFFAFRPHDTVAPAATLAPTGTVPASIASIATAVEPASSASAAAPEGTASAPGVSSTALRASQPMASPSETVDIIVSGGRLIKGPTVIRATAGDHVSMRITSDVEDELHLHGYNLKLHLRPNVPATLSFEARRTGRFPYELHRRDVELGALEVYPR